MTKIQTTPDPMNPPIEVNSVAIKVNEMEIQVISGDNDKFDFKPYVEADMSDFLFSNTDPAESLFDPDEFISDPLSVPCASGQQ